MRAIALLVLTLANQGYWFGGRENTIAVQWSLESGVPAAVLHWEVAVDQMKLPGGSGQVALPEGQKASTVTIKLPEVRVRTPMRWIYRVTSPDGAKEFARGEQTLELFPRNLMDGLAKRVGQKTIIAWDKAAGLPAALAAAKIEHQAIEHASQFTMARPDVVLVGPEQLADEPGGQAALQGLAEAGASVMIFRQTKPEKLMAYALTGRRIASAEAAPLADAGAGAAPASDQVGAAPERKTRLDYRFNHPLLQDFDLRDWQVMEHAATDDLTAVELPADEPALELIYWPREGPGKEPVPIDALLVTKSVGTGRIVLCQLPLGPWQDDPRSQMILVNALNYLLTRPEPTLRPSERPASPATVAPRVPTIPLH